MTSTFQMTSGTVHSPYHGVSRAASPLKFGAWVAGGVTDDNGSALGWVGAFSGGMIPNLEEGSAENVGGVKAVGAENVGGEKEALGKLNAG